MATKKVLLGLVELPAGEFEMVLPPQINTPMANALATTALEEVYIVCDSTLGEVKITLPEIASFNKNWQTKIYVTDIATVKNPVTVFSQGTNTIGDGTEVVISSINGVDYFHIVSDNNWMCLSNSGGGAGATEYKQGLLPFKSYASETIARPEYQGEFIDLGLSVAFFYPGPFVKRANGNLLRVDYCSAILKSEVFIFECYDLLQQDEDPSSIYGYWVAFKPDPADPRRLEKVAELQMTQQFWDEWWSGNLWTVQDSGENTVKFVKSIDANNSSTVLQSWITTLNYNNGVLTATDSTVTFGGSTVQSLYESYFGTIVGLPNWDYRYPEYILQDDYYGMAVGAEKGWYWYRDSNAGGTSAWKSVGFNILTGQTKSVDAVTAILGTVTNFNSGGVDPNKMIVQWYNHPHGITYQFADAQLVNNGDNVNGVTCLWSPYYLNPTLALYITSRQIVGTSAAFLAQGGEMPKSFYWDNFHIYVYQYDASPQDCYRIDKFNVNTKQLVDSFSVPYTYWQTLQSGSNLNIYAENEGILFAISPTSLNYNDPIYDNFSNWEYIWVSANEKFYRKLQSNNIYPTSVIKNKAYSAQRSSLIFNNYSVGVEIDEYSGFTFNN